MPRHATGRRPKRNPKATVYVFKVALAAQKTIWRHIAVRSDQTLDDLHDGIFDAFDRFDEHLYSFFLGPPGIEPSRRSRGVVEYTSPIDIEDADPFDGHPVHDASLATLGSLGLEPRVKLRYLFDFGDEWWHEITVEQAAGSPEPGRYPRVLEKRGDSPPQYPDLEDDWEEDEEE